MVEFLESITLANLRRTKRMVLLTTTLHMQKVGFQKGTRSLQLLSKKGGLCNYSTPVGTKSPPSTTCFWKLCPNCQKKERKKRREMKNLC
jgi:hypothetical protein